MSKELTIVLVNRAFPYNCVGKLTGWSGVEYGVSVFEEAYGAHVCRLPLSKWRECKRDVTNGYVRRWGQWEVDIEVPEEGKEEDTEEAEIGARENDKAVRGAAGGKAGSAPSRAEGSGERMNARQTLTGENAAAPASSTAPH